MPGQSADNLLALFDAAPLNRRYWVTFVLLSALFVLEFFDFLIVGYLLAVLAPQWHLTYGQSAVILYSGGVGAILGALVFGGLSDAWGHKITMIIGTFICAASSGLMGIVPAGSWEIFAVLRFFIGVGLTAGVTPSLAIQVELTPTRHRTLLTSFYLVFASAGGFLASGASAALLEPLGWRGVAMVLSVPVPQAAKFFVFVTLGGVAGKIVVTLLAPLTGRRWLGVVWGVGGVVALAAAGYYSNVVVGGVPAMVILLCASTFFIEGGFASFAPYNARQRRWGWATTRE